VESRLVVKIDGSQAEAAAKRLERSLKGMSDAGEKASRKMPATQKAMNALKGTASLAAKAVTGLGVAFGGLVVASRYIGQMSDSVAMFRGQLRNVSSDTAQAETRFSALRDVSNETGTALNATISLFTRMSRATAQLGVSQERLTAITGTINKAFTLSGASAQEASNSLLQLSQGMAAGALRGEELNSVMENAPILAQAIADSMGIAYGELRGVAKEGGITTEVIIKAMEDMRAKIDTEFENIPMTIGRASNVIRNNLQAAFTEVDISEATEGLMDFAEQLKDPDFIKSLADLAEGIMQLTTWFIKVGAGAVNAAKDIGEFFARLVGGRGGAGTVAEMLKELNEVEVALKKVGERSFFNAGVHKRLTAQHARLTLALSLGSKEQDKINASMEEYFDHLLRDVIPATEGVRDNYVSLSSAGGEFRVVTDEMTAAARKELVQRRELAAEMKAQKAAYDEMISAMRAESAVLQMTERDRRYYNQVVKLGTEITSEQREELYAVIDAQLAFEDAQKKSTKATEDGNEALKNQSKEYDMWGEAAGQAISRVDSAFADMWQGAFKSFDEFADRLKSAFLQLIGELAHAAITKPILLNIGAAMGIGGAQSAVASGAGQIGGVGGISGLLGGIGNMGAGLFNSIGQGASFLADLGLPGMGSLSTNAFQTGMTMTGGTALAGAGAGLVGGLLGNKVFGETSGIGSTIGGIGGMIFGGPLGAGIGSFLGSGLESLLSGKPSDKTGTALLDLASGRITEGGLTGKKFSQENRDAAAELAQTFSAFSSIVGGRGSLDIGVGNRDGLRLDGRDFGSDIDGFLEAGFDKILDSAENLTPALREIIDAFDGTAEETMRYAQSLITLRDVMDFDPLAKAAEDIQAALDGPSSMTDAYERQIDLINTLTDNFDGSQAALDELTGAMATGKQMAYEMAVAIRGVSDAIEVMTKDAVAYYEQFLGGAQEEVDPATRIEQLNAEIGGLLDSLSNALDPAAIKGLSEEILGLNRERFGLFGEDQQADAAQLSIDTATQVQELAQDNVAANFQSASDAFAAGVETWIANNNVNVNVTVRQDGSVEVNA